jgi:hypothetical protein
MTYCHKLGLSCIHTHAHFTAHTVSLAYSTISFEPSAAPVPAKILLKEKYTLHLYDVNIFQRMQFSTPAHTAQGGCQHTE